MTVKTCSQAPTRMPGSNYFYHYILGSPSLKVAFHWFLLQCSQPPDKPKLVVRYAMKLDLVSLACLAGWWAVRYKIVGTKVPQTSLSVSKYKVSWELLELKPLTSRSQNVTPQVNRITFTMSFWFSKFLKIWLKNLMLCASLFTFYSLNQFATPFQIHPSLVLSC